MSPLTVGNPKSEARNTKQIQNPNDQNPFDDKMKPYGPNGYPDDWEACCLWDGKISVHFGYAEHGWVLLSLLTTAFNGSLVIHLSEVFDPFWDMVDWLKSVARDDIPASFKIDEEGRYKELIVRRYAGRYSDRADIEFRINGDFWDPEKEELGVGCFILSRCTRFQLLDEFTRRLEQWLQTDYDRHGWRPSGSEEVTDSIFADLKNLDIHGLRELISSNRRLRPSGGSGRS